MGYNLKDLEDIEAGGGLEEGVKLAVRIKPYNPQKGYTLQRYHVMGQLFRTDRGWYKTGDIELLKVLAQSKQDPYAEESRDVFDIVDLEEAEKIDIRARQPKAAPAGEATEIPARRTSTVTTRDAVARRGKTREELEAEKEELPMIDGADGEDDLTPDEIEAGLTQENPEIGRKSTATPKKNAPPVKSGRRPSR